MIITSRKRSCGKVTFLHLSVCSQGEGSAFSQVCIVCLQGGQPTGGICIQGGLLTVGSLPTGGSASGCLHPGCLYPGGGSAYRGSLLTGGVCIKGGSTSRRVCIQGVCPISQLPPEPEKRAVHNTLKCFLV